MYKCKIESGGMECRWSTSTNLCWPYNWLPFYYYLLRQPLPPVTLGSHGVGNLLETGDVGTDNQGRDATVGVGLSSVPACLVYTISRVHVNSLLDLQHVCMISLSLESTSSELQLYR
jgi:hypothetical protein